VTRRGKKTRNKKEEIGNLLYKDCSEAGTGKREALVKENETGSERGGDLLGLNYYERSCPREPGCTGKNTMTGKAATRKYAGNHVGNQVCFKDKKGRGPVLLLQLARRRLLVKNEGGLLGDGRWATCW